MYIYMYLPYRESSSRVANSPKKYKSHHFNFMVSEMHLSLPMLLLHVHILELLANIMQVMCHW